MKELYELCVKAFYEGTNRYGEVPLAFSKDTFRISYNPSNPDAINLTNLGADVPAYFMACLTCSQSSGDTCGVGVGIYPYDNGERIFFQSGCRVFDVAVTPEIHQAFDKIMQMHFNLSHQRIKGGGV